MNQRITQKKLIARLIVTEEERAQAFRLRHDIFTEELGWTDSEKYETDEFDVGSDFLGLFDGNKLVAFTRITKHTSPWMFEKVDVFKLLIDQPLVKTLDSVESTRYFVSRNFRGQHQINGYKVFYSQLFLYSFYEYCLMKGARKVYCVFLMPIFRLLRRQGLPIYRIDSKRKSSAKNLTVPTVIDWELLDPKKFFKTGLLELVSIKIDSNYFNKFLLT
ncbi:MAG: hypothetical protein COB67_05195 [SAR324 cluster bacterium]|uniref:Acyl-homoserine-lactone synthase n=1 Tax=SAR324 cluster bacterium TaxID=2024889 RepID=A0A2A4T6M7_9DELT|nr:MAG: hypothetical protein COB67_05195 [SAR324 cluster bacterium]